MLRAQILFIHHSAVSWAKIPKIAHNLVRYRSRNSLGRGGGAPEARRGTENDTPRLECSKKDHIHE